MDRGQVSASTKMGIYFMRESLHVFNETVTSAEAQEEVYGELKGMLETWKAEPKISFAILLAVGEALTNAFTHGRLPITVHFHYSRGHLRIKVEDSGDGFDPCAVPDPRRPENLETPSGRGLLLMRHSMDTVRFVRNPKQRGMRVVMTKHVV